MGMFDEGVEALIRLFHGVHRNVASDIALGRDVDTFQMLPGEGGAGQEMVLEVRCLPKADQGGGPFAPAVRVLTVAYRPVGESPEHEIEARLEMVEGLSLKELLMRSPDVFQLASFGMSVHDAIRYS